MIATLSTVINYCNVNLFLYPKITSSKNLIYMDFFGYVYIKRLYLLGRCLIYVYKRVIMM